MKTIAIIQVRMNSKRLPGKVMLKILDKPVIWHIHNRLNQCKNLDDIVISTGEENTNQQIIDFAKKSSISFFSGSEKDLIRRLYETAIKFDASQIIRITGDCPCVDPDIVEQLINENEKSNYKYDVITNSFSHSFPHGLEMELWSTKILKKLDSEIKELKFREWFTTYVKNNSEKFRILEIKNDIDLSNNRWTLDYSEDLKLIKKIYNELFNGENIFKMKDILSFLNKNPELKKINLKYVGEHNIDAPKN